MNISFWIESPSSFSVSIERLFYLFNLFISKRYTGSKKEDIEKSISSSWTMLLSSFTDEQLRSIIQKQPLFQCVLPTSFFDKNVNSLSIDYGFPSEDVCKSYLQNRIKNLSSTTEYTVLKNAIIEADRKNAYHRKDPTTIAQIIHAWPTRLEVPKSRIEYLHPEVLNKYSKSLDDHYLEILPLLLKEGLNGICNPPLSIDSLKNKTNVDLLTNLGLFLDQYHVITECATVNPQSLSTIIFTSYFEKIATENQVIAESLLPTMKHLSNVYVEQLINAPYRLLVYLGEAYHHLYQYLDNNTICKLFNTIETALETTTDSNDIIWAFNDDWVNEDKEKEMIEKYIRLSSNHSVSKLESDLQHSNLPDGIQVYLISQIIQKGGFTDKIEWLKSKVGSSISKQNFITAIEPFTNNMNEAERSKLLIASCRDVLSEEYEDYLERLCKDSLSPEEYDLYSGTYAHDEAGFTDEEIDTLLGGDPSAYWNID